MKNKMLKLVVVMILAILLFIIPGCAANRVDLVDTGVLSLEQHTTGKVYITWADIYEDRDGFVVTGVLRRRDTAGPPVKVHVDITILSPEGKILNEGRSSDIYIPRRIYRRTQTFKRFEVSFPGIPPEGSKVTITAHNSPHNNTENNSNS
ncbi:MAG: hypothetical protein ACYTBP_09525 [Planctomycetota bacterium]